MSIIRNFSKSQIGVIDRGQGHNHPIGLFNSTNQPTRESMKAKMSFPTRRGIRGEQAGDRPAQEGPAIDQEQLHRPQEKTHSGVVGGDGAHPKILRTSGSPPALTAGNYTVTNPF
jgi:hypothetical protein